MRPTHEHDIAHYLCAEANRVEVHDTLDDIEDGVTVVSFVSRPVGRRRPLVLLGVAATVVFVAGALMVRNDSSPQQAGGLAASPIVSPDRSASESSTTVVSTAPSITTVPAVAPVRVPLPAGGQIQGLDASCTTTDSIVYDCTIAEYPFDGLTGDMTGFSTIIVDDSSRVSGGCRSISVDGTHFLCAVGQGAVGLDLVSAEYLGDWAPRGYIAG